MGEWVIRGVTVMPRFVLQRRKRTNDGEEEILAPYFRYGVIDRRGQQKREKVEETYVQRNGPLLVGHAERTRLHMAEFVPLSFVLGNMASFLYHRQEHSTVYMLYFRSIYTLVTIFVGMVCGHGVQLSRDRERHSFTAFKNYLVLVLPTSWFFGHQKGLPNKQSPYFSFSFFSMQISSICKHSTLPTQWLTLRILSKQANMSSSKCPATTSSVLS